MTTTHAAELNNGVWTSYLPISSAWTSQAACNTAAWARFGIDTTNSLLPYIYDPAYAQSVANSLTCLPPEATSWWQGGTTVSNTVTSYSIGPIVCPAAYTTYSTSIVAGSSTSVICCPSNFKYARSIEQNAGIDGVCTSAMTSGHVLTYASPTSNSYVSATMTLSSQVLMMAVPVEGYNFAASTTSSAAGSSTTRSSATGSSTNPANTPTGVQSSTTSVAPTSTSTEPSGLTAGAKAGIGGGVAGAALLGIAALAAFLFFRRRRRNQYATAPAEMPGSSMDSKDRTLVEASAEPAVQRWEVDGNSRRAELQA